MRVLQHVCSSHAVQDCDLSALIQADPHLVLVFGSVEYFTVTGIASRLATHFPDAAVVGCTTAGEITGTGAEDSSCVITALHFEHTNVAVVSARSTNIEESQAVGHALGVQLKAHRSDLCAILVFSKGLAINGSALIDGMQDAVGNEVSLSGGLAGDGGVFRQTFVLSPSGVFDDQIVAVGLYGDRLKVGYGSFGGWEPFGPTRKVTRAKGTVLNELDGQPVLDIYKRYLGDYARELPASGLLFPFEMLNSNSNPTGIIRTILGVDEADGSLILAGSIEEQGFLRLMHASPDSLVSGADKSAAAAIAGIGVQPEFALLVSCVGRKLVMGDQVDDEIDAVVEHLPEHTVVSGFYSYGEICPQSGTLECCLHNQTMTVTVLGEE